jgi:hypothetical protein
MASAASVGSMFRVVHPLFILVVSFVAMWLSAVFGWSVLRKRLALDGQIREDFNIIAAAALTLLGLTIGFTFSMATGRYDQRKNYEEEEANAIGTEYLRSDLLPPADGATVRALLRSYLDERIAFYETGDEEALKQIDARTARVQGDLWSAILPPARADPSPVMALVVSGMNDVLNSQGYTQSAFWYRIPTAAWVLMAAIAIGCNLLVGYGSRAVAGGGKLLLILPLLIAVAFMLIADIDTPRHGIIRVRPQNLTSLADSLRPR